MKRLVLFLGITIAVSVFTWALKAQTKPNQKTYHVTLTLDQWQNVMNGLEGVKNAVKTSSMSAAQATYISDSILNVYQNEFSRQIQGQLAAEQKPKSDVKKDTTNKNKKN